MQVLFSNNSRERIAVTLLFLSIALLPRWENKTKNENHVVQAPFLFRNAAGVSENLALNILLKWLKLEKPRFSKISSVDLFVRIISLYAF